MGFLDAWMYCFLDSWVQDCLSGFASVSLSNLQLPCVPLAAYRFFHQVLSGPLDHCPSLCQVYFPRQNKYILDLEALKAYILCPNIPEDLSVLLVNSVASGFDVHSKVPTTLYTSFQLFFQSALGPFCGSNSWLFHLFIFLLLIWCSPRCCLQYWSSCAPEVISIVAFF